MTVTAKSPKTVNASDLRKLPSAEVHRLLREIGPDKAEELRYDWSFWARPEQLEPKTPYKEG